MAIQRQCVFALIDMLSGLPALLVYYIKVNLSYLPDLEPLFLKVLARGLTLHSIIQHHSQHTKFSYWNGTDPDYRILYAYKLSPMTSWYTIFSYHDVFQNDPKINQHYYKSSRICSKTLLTVSDGIKYRIEDMVKATLQRSSVKWPCCKENKVFWSEGWNWTLLSIIIISPIMDAVPCNQWRIPKYRE